MNIPVITVKKDDYGFFLHVTRVINDKTIITYVTDRVIADLLNMLVVDYHNIFLSIDENCSLANGITHFAIESDAQQAFTTVNNILQEKWINKTLFFST